MANIPDWVVFPEKEWRILTPTEAGFLEPEFSNEMNANNPRPSTFWGEQHGPNEFATVITRGGYLVKRWGRTRDYLYQTASVGKAFTRALLGLAVEKRGLDPDQPVWRTWTGAGELSHPHKYMDNEIHRAITWRHLVDHTAGWGIENAAAWPHQDEGYWWNEIGKWTGDPMFDMYSLRPPGVQYYSSGNSVRLGHALTAFWKQDLKAVLDRELFSKIGIPAGGWRWMSLKEVFDTKNLYPEQPGYGEYADPPYAIGGGVVRGGPGWVLMTSEDLARFGLLVATGGIWKGERLLGPEWLQSKGGAISNGVFGESTFFVAGGRVATDGLPDYLLPKDFQEFHFPEHLINPLMEPGGAVHIPPVPAPHVFGVQRTGALYRAYWDGAWGKTVLDNRAGLASLSATFDSAASAPLAFGVRKANRRAFYEAYWKGNAWTFKVLQGASRLADLDAVFDLASGTPQVFGIAVADKALYQAYQDDERDWQFRVLDARAGLARLSAVYDLQVKAPLVFGATVGGALYQAAWDGDSDTWRFATLDASAGLSAVSAVFDLDSGEPQVFGIKGGALYQAYREDRAWKFRVLDAGANLASLSAVYGAYGGRSGPRRVFGIKADSGALYQASWNGSWQFEVIDVRANLTALSTVFDVGSGAPQVFGIRKGTGALYQAYWTGSEWKTRELDANANLTQIASAFGRARLVPPVVRRPRPRPKRQPVRA